MSDIVGNISEQQNSAQSNEIAQITKIAEESSGETVTNAVPTDACKAAPSDNNAKVGESLPEPHAEKSPLSISPKVENKKTPAKRTPSKRMSFIERAQKESEELVKTMGGSLEMDGGRRTRSSTRGTPTRSAAVSTPPPVKKARTSPASGASTPTRGRGRGRKIDTTAADGSAEAEITLASKRKNAVKEKKSTGKQNAAGDEHMEGIQDDNQIEKKSENEDSKGDIEEIDKEAASGESIVTVSKSENRGFLEKVGCDEGMEIITTEGENEETAKEYQREDLTDSVLQPVVGETHSQEITKSIATEKNVTSRPENVVEVEVGEVMKSTESKKNEVPMETEEHKNLSNVTKEKPKINQSNEETISVKELNETTPEPMEVDSSSKSNDSSGRMDADIIEVVVEKSTPANVSEKTHSESFKLAEKTTSDVSEFNKVEKVEGKLQQNSIEPAFVVSPAANAVANNDSSDIKLVGEPAAANVEIGSASENNTETTPAATDSNKSENDLCEPKIATSPPISAANESSSVTTPQTCN